MPASPEYIGVPEAGREDDASDPRPLSTDDATFTRLLGDQVSMENDQQMLSVVRRFIEDNFQHRPRYLKEWRDFILGNELAIRELFDAIRLVDNNEDVLPPRSLLLKALTYRPPRDIKAMIVINDPIPYPNLATGLAFSFPKNLYAIPPEVYESLHECLMGNQPMSPNTNIQGRSMAMMKLALMQADIETDRDINNFCYEHWAERGVLLWNSALSLRPNQMHHNVWLNFSKILLTLILENAPEEPILGMFWGRSVQGVYDYAALDLSSRKLACAARCECYDHPASSSRNTNNFMTMAVSQFRSSSHLFQPPSNASYSGEGDVSDSAPDR